MRVDGITAELRHWLTHQAEAGQTDAQSIAAMLVSGWDQQDALQALQVFKTGEALPGLRLQKIPDPIRPDAQPCAGTLWAGDREVRVLLSMRSPRIVVLGGLLSDEECDALIAISTLRMVRSETIATNSEGVEFNPARTSDGMFFARGENEIVQRIEARLAALLAWPLEHGEGLQVLHYRAGAEYQPHFDYFNPEHPATPEILQRGGQRLATVVMYLSSVTAGGATIFPDAGLEIMPVKGNAVFFSYDRPHPATGTLHGGALVLAGHKWVATKWLREGQFD